jgi:hypothetical protein
LATKQIASACASRRAATPGSFAAERPARFVIPNAVNFAAVVRFSEKKAVSSGFAPG